MSKWNNGYSVGDLRSKLYENVKNENGGFLNNNVRYYKNIEDTTKLQKEIERLNNIIDKAVNKVQDIIDIGFDYDGYNDVDNLKILVDELVDLARQTKNILNGRSDE